jgi:multicomponent Na+:H+ antiporter subunit D
MKALLVLPILIPLVTAAISLLAWRWPTVQRWLGVIGAAALFGVATALLFWVRSDGIQAMQIGSWPAPYGITVVADLFATIMVLLAGIMGLAVGVYSLASMDSGREAFGYYPLLQVLLAGVCGAFLTGDLFNLYVWFEVMLIASFVLLSLGGERAQLEGAIKYVTLNLLSSALFLTGVGIIYGVVGTLNMADLHVKLQEVPPGMATTLAMLFLVAFGIKAAAFPLFFWLPASYHTPPVAVSAIFAGLLTKVGVYALIRVFTLLFMSDPGYTYTLILWISGLTMVTGVLGAMAQNEFRRILSFHIVSQIGYMIMGLALFGLATTPALSILALGGAIFYILHHIIVKTNLFLVSGIVFRLRGTQELKELGGISNAYPGLALLFLIPAMSLAGLPPLSGFFAKLSLVQAGLGLEQYVIVAVALAVSLLTLFSMTKIWTEAFWKPAPGSKDGREESTHQVSWGSYGLLVTPVVVLAAMTVIIGLGAGPLFNLSVQAAGQLQDPSEYLRVVLGGGG